MVENNRVPVVLSEVNSISSSGTDKKVAVFIHLYYDDDLEFYTSYIANIRKNTDIFVCYSNDTLKKRVESILKKIDVVPYFIYKENRGRDISALLVKFRELAMSYEYFCFVHDKRIEVKEWTYSLWHNMLASDIYIQNIIDYFEKNNSVGILAPVPTITDDSLMAIDNLWRKNFDNVNALLSKLSIGYQIDRDISPMMQGTCFWCRSKAVKKVFDYNWRYTDFPEEPLAADGTISHAVERIWEYAAYDEGFSTKWVLSDVFASSYISKCWSYLTKSRDFLSIELGIDNYTKIDNYKELICRIENYINEDKNFYIYGIGQKCQRLKRIISHIGITPKSYVVSKNNYGSDYDGIPIMELSEIIYTGEEVFLLAVSSEYRAEIENGLVSRKVPLERCIYLDL